MSDSLTLPALPRGTSVGESLDAYLAAIHRIPLLTVQEEKDLALRYRNDGDLKAAQRLVLSNLRFVAYIARGYAGYGLPLGDLIQEGNLGLMKAVKRFDPAQGVRLISFAVYWIRSEIHEFILRNWRIVRIATTKAQRKLFFNLRRKTARWIALDQEQRKSLAREFKTTPEEIEAMHVRLSGTDISYDGDPEEETDDATPAPALYLSAEKSDPEEILAEEEQGQHGHEALSRALVALDPRSRDIIEKRWLASEKATLQDLAAQHGVSAERIRQIEAQALRRLRQPLQAAGL
ncbi:MAG: RNA polymerase sigma factor RpoH [Gammaproteobacteria bacterium]|nr:RNA polymerase sigma factor RpoH [Gammaproteobacteria bacterium]